MSERARALARAHAERVLSPEAFAEALGAPISDAEMAEHRALIRWFVTRYPTPAQRLAYARRASARLWVPTSPPPGSPTPV